VLTEKTAVSDQLSAISYQPKDLTIRIKERHETSHS